MSCCCEENEKPFLICNLFGEIVRLQDKSKALRNLGVKDYIDHYFCEHIKLVDNYVKCEAKPNVLYLVKDKYDEIVEIYYGQYKVNLSQNEDYN